MIPVGVISGLRITQEHPYVTGIVFAALLALAIFAAKRSRRSPQRKNALRAVSLASAIAAVAFFSWAYNTRTPGLAEQVAQFANQVAVEQVEQTDTVESGAK